VEMTEKSVFHWLISTVRVKYWPFAKKKAAECGDLILHSAAFLKVFP